MWIQLMQIDSSALVYERDENTEQDAASKHEYLDDAYWLVYDLYNYIVKKKIVVDKHSASFNAQSLELRYFTI